MSKGTELAENDLNAVNFIGKKSARQVLGNDRGLAEGELFKDIRMRFANGVISAAEKIMPLAADRDELNLLVLIRLQFRERVMADIAIKSPAQAAVGSHYCDGHPLHRALTQQWMLFRIYTTANVPQDLIELLSVRTSGEYRFLSTAYPRSRYELHRIRHPLNILDAGYACPELT